MTDGLFPEDSAERKTYPVFSGLLQYFPSALAAIANHSYLGNEKHNKGLPLHHDRAKSDDEPDALARHLMEGDYIGMAWRALSLLQKDLESKGAPIAPAARNVSKYDPNDVAFRKDALYELAAESQAWGMYDSPADLRHIGIGDVPKAGRIVPIVGGAKAERDGKIAFAVRWDRRHDKTAPGTPADTAYLASFGPNVGSASSEIADISCDAWGNVTLSGHARRKTDGVVADARYLATNAAIPQHPMAAEALRDHDERLAGPESHL